MRIVTNRQQNSELATTFNVTRQAVWQALNFKTNSILSRRIRCHAVNQLKAMII